MYILMVSQMCPTCIRPCPIHLSLSANHVDSFHFCFFPLNLSICSLAERDVHVVCHSTVMTMNHIQCTIHYMCCIYDMCCKYILYEFISTVHVHVLKKHLNSQSYSHQVFCHRVEPPLHLSPLHQHLCMQVQHTCTCTCTKYIHVHVHVQSIYMYMYMYYVKDTTSIALSHTWYNSYCMKCCYYY